jgi:hypothetical protein
VGIKARNDYFHIANNCNYLICDANVVFVLVSKTTKHSSRASTGELEVLAGKQQQCSPISFTAKAEKREVEKRGRKEERKRRREEKERREGEKRRREEKGEERNEKLSILALSIVATTIPHSNMGVDVWWVWVCGWVSVGGWVVRFAGATTFAVMSS